MAQPTKTPLSEALKRLVGQPVSAIDTPALVLDLDAMQRNLSRMAEFARKHDIPLAARTPRCTRARARPSCRCRPARRRLRAEDWRGRGDGGGRIHNVYISNEVVAPAKLARVAELAHRLAIENGRLAIAVDSLEGVGRLANAMDDRRQRRRAGGDRTCSSRSTSARAAAACPPGGRAGTRRTRSAAIPALRFAGLQAYHGKAQHLRTPQARREAIARVVQDVQLTRGLIDAGASRRPGSRAPAPAAWCARRRAACSASCKAGSSCSMEADPTPPTSATRAQPQFEHARS
jgi:D-serine deaminase-like pyridoxal phosphate-dependent protein